MFCQSCGKENPVAAEFCQHCGSAIPRNAGAPPPSATAPTAHPAHPAHTGAIGQYAGFWLRFAAIMIDGLIWSVVAGVVLALLFAMLFASFMAGGAEVLAIVFFVVSYLGVYLGWFFYHAYCESSDWQGSIGKRVLGLYVTDTEGRRLTFGRAAGRNFSRIITNLTAGVGYIMAGFTVRKQALHDMVADCLVCRRP